MSRRHSYLGLVVIVAGVCWSGTAFAQGGRGGFGMGGPGGMGPMGLVGLEPVQKEIGLEGESLEKVKKLMSSFQEELRSESEKAGLPTGPGAFQNLTPEERAAMNEKRSAVMRKINEKFMPQMKEVITPAQFERVQQIQWQVAGSQALTNHDLAKMLDITKEQQEKLMAINQEFMGKMRELAPGAGGGGNFQEIQAKRQELMKARDGKANEVLTKEQQEKYTKLKGKPFDVAQLMQGPPRRGNNQ